MAYQNTRAFKRILPTIRKKMPEMWVGDSETWRHASNPAFWIFKRMDSSEKIIFYSKSEVREWVNHKRIVCYFHNLEFDLATFMTAEEVAISRKICAGSKIIRLNFGAVEFRDSLALLTTSVASLGDSFRLPKGKTPQKFIDGDSSQGLNSDDLVYCERDIDIVIFALNDLLEFYWKCCKIGSDFDEYDDAIPAGFCLPLTAASLAYRIYSASFWCFEFNTIYIKKDAFFDTLKTYYGGRVQVFAEAGKIYSKTYVYDINSLYPSVMTGNYYPHPKYCYKEKCSVSALKLKMAQDRLVWGEFEMVAGKNAVLFLPSTDENGRRNYNQKEFSGWLCQPEIQFALENGWRINRVKTLYSAVKIRPFDSYVNYFYNLRKKFQANGDSREYFVKILLNSLYGKFGQKDNTDRIENPDKIKAIMADSNWPESYEIGYYTKNLWYLTEKKSGRPSKNTWAGFSAFTTSYARVKLAESIRDNPTLYCDTDSIHTQISPEKIDLPLTNEIGDWKLEYVGEKSQFWEPKAYRFMDENFENLLVKHKGANRSDGDLTKPQIAVSFIKYRSALRRKITYGEFQNVIKKSKRFCDENL